MLLQGAEAHFASPPAHCKLQPRTKRSSRYVVLHPHPLGAAAIPLHLSPPPAPSPHQPALVRAHRSGCARPHTPDILLVLRILPCMWSGGTGAQTGQCTGWNTRVGTRNDGAGCREGALRSVEDAVRPMPRGRAAQRQGNGGDRARCKQEQVNATVTRGAMVSESPHTSLVACAQCPHKQQRTSIGPPCRNP